MTKARFLRDTVKVLEAGSVTESTKIWCKS
ncbi:RB69ORF189c hypothetical protein [Escherichia phage RB69]|uniref:Uncharacterized protein RB69ORF189c n=1 Tax=Escherichia phage RB69 TaxID=12353 RepID=Q7Y4W0_BPR69|nr:RB69ORF189c hypothetical protein [Escherichia phage RB69]AAP76088.1 RB69ORF189c hypothetical protein [Escherichia phage RB69]